MAQDLLKAANAARDARTRSLLHKAASALGHGDKQRAQSALRKAAKRLRSGSSSRKARSGLTKTQKALDSAKYRLTPTRNGKLQGGSLVNPEAKYSHEPKNSAAPSKGTTSNRRNVSPQGPASGLDAKHDRADSGQPIDSGSQGRFKQQNGSGKGKPAGFGLVYLQGRLSKGTFNVEVGPNGEVRRVAASRYQHVVAQYAHSAEVAAGKASLPPSLQTYVRRYFVVLTHP
jgi:hypothetical protein